MSNAVPVDAEELARLRESHAELLVALQLIADDCAEHPAFLGEDATDDDMKNEGGDSATITYWHHIASSAIDAARQQPREKK